MRCRKTFDGKWEKMRERKTVAASPFDRKSEQAREVVGIQVGTVSKRHACVSGRVHIKITKFINHHVFFSLLINIQLMNWWKLINSQASLTLVLKKFRPKRVTNHKTYFLLSFFSHPPSPSLAVSSFYQSLSHLFGSIFPSLSYFHLLLPFLSFCIFAWHFKSE